MKAKKRKPVRIPLYPGTNPETVEERLRRNVNAAANKAILRKKWR